MRASSRTTRLFMLVIGLCTLIPAVSSAHGVMTTPAARSIGLPNEAYQFCFGEPECVCGEYDEPGAIVATYEAGQIIQVTIDVTRSHDRDSIFRFQLCPTDQVSQECMTEGQFATLVYDETLGPRTYEITLPEDVVCDPCVLRWKWDYGFLSCADVRITGVQVKGEGQSWTSLKATFR